MTSIFVAGTAGHVVLSALQEDSAAGCPVSC